MIYVKTSFLGQALQAGLTEDQAFKYHAYAMRKQKLIDRENLMLRDCHRNKVYTAEEAFERDAANLEIKFESISEAQSYADRILKSKTWEKIDGGITKTVSVKPLNKNSKMLGYATILGNIIKLHPKSGLTKFTLLHEMAHLVGKSGCTNHGIKFRQFHVALVSRFLGKAAGDLLYKSYRNEGLKMAMNYKIKSPHEWLKVSAPVAKRGSAKK